MTNQERFEASLTKHYTELFANDAEYAYARSITTPAAMANKMTAALKANSADKEGKGIKRTCKELGIAHTYTAIENYLTA